MAAIANLIIEQGASFSSSVTVKDVNGNPYDLKNHTASAKMALGYSSTRTRTVITTTINSPESGVIVLSLTADQTSNLEAPARYVYDIDITASDSTVTRVIEGIITTRPNV